MKTKLEDTYDYIICGGGTAGCVLANRLSAEHSVLLVERGPEDDHEAILDSHISRLERLWKDPRYAHQVPLVDVVGGNIRKWPTTLQGKTLGGGGSVNVMIHVRGNAKDFADWEAEGAEGWGFEEMLRHYRAVEKFQPAPNRPFDPKYRNKDGMIEVRVGGKTMYGEALCAAAMNYGFDGPDHDHNGASQIGVGPFQFAVDEDGKRFSPARGYLRPAQKDNGARLHVVTETVVARVLLEGSKNDWSATGVVLVDSEKQLERPVSAAKEVIVACGAYESPKLLMLSGIGAEEHIAKHEVEHRHELKGVGDRLQDHVITSVLYDGGRALPALNFFTEIGLFAHVEDHKKPKVDFKKPANVQFFMNPGIPSRKWDGQASVFFGIYPSLARVHSMGTVRLANWDPRRDPVIQHNHLNDVRDLRRLANAVRVAKSIAEDSALDDFREKSSVIPSIRYEHPDKNAPLEAYMKFAATYSRGLWHPAGSCKMGRLKDGAVVDPSLRVHGVKRLRVCDASIMPVLTTGNPNATVLAIAEKGAELILKDA